MEKAANEFNRRWKDREERHTVCRPCSRERSRVYYLRNRERMIALATASQTRRREERAEYTRRYRLKVRFGITPEEWDALFELQGGLCAVCGTDEPGAWHTDHCHDTGVVRGILCRACNTGIGQLDDSPERLEAAAAYLRRPRG